MIATAILTAAMLGPGAADQWATDCRWVPRLALAEPKPRATLVRKPYVIQTAKPGPKVKRLKPAPSPAYDYVCDTAGLRADGTSMIEPIVAEPVALVAEVPPSFADFALPVEPTEAGVAEPSSYAAAPAVFFGGGGAVFVAGPVVYMPVAAVAEPESYLLILAGLLAIAVMRKVKS